MSTDQRGPVLKYSSDDLQQWFQVEDRPMFVGDAIDSSNSPTMSAGFARFRQGEELEWTVAYDEVLVVTKGAVTIRTASGEQTAGVGEILFLPKDTELAYVGAEDTEFVFVSYPHWFEAKSSSPSAAQLERFRETGEAVRI